MPQLPFSGCLLCGRHLIRVLIFTKYCTVFYQNMTVKAVGKMNAKLSFCSFVFV